MHFQGRQNPNPEVLDECPRYFGLLISHIGCKHSDARLAIIRSEAFSSLQMFFESSENSNKSCFKFPKKQCLDPELSWCRDDKTAWRGHRDAVATGLGTLPLGSISNDVIVHNTSFLNRASFKHVDESLCDETGSQITLKLWFGTIGQLFQVPRRRLLTAS